MQPDTSPPTGTDERGARELVYDTEINPLMAQIIAICKRADIPLIADFRLDSDMKVTTAIPAALGYDHGQLKAYYALTRNASLALLMTTSTASGEGL